MIKERRKNIWDRLQPADLVAMLIILGVLILDYKGINTMLSMSVLLIIGYYFGRTLQKGTPDGK